jgi:tripartite-type tricarboxylate transporter receptor subunit TctC
MKIARQVILGAAIALAAFGQASAQDWPTRSADFTPVVPFGETPLVVVTAVGRYNTLAELIAAAKAKPGELNYSTVGIGSAAHFGAVRLAVSAGITRVPSGWPTRSRGASTSAFRR